MCRLCARCSKTYIKNSPCSPKEFHAYCRDSKEVERLHVEVRGPWESENGLESSKA